MQKANRKVIVNGQVITPNRTIDNGVVIIEDDKIVGVEDSGAVSTENAEIIDARGLIVAPGFIDIQPMVVMAMTTWTARQKRSQLF